MQTLFSKLTKKILPLLFVPLLAHATSGTVNLGSGISQSVVGQPNGVASLDSTGKVPSAQIPGGGGGSTAWGAITGTLSNQTDLQSALNAKQNTIAGNTCSAGQYATQINTSGTLLCSALPASGTVTSVATTVPAWLTVSGSPITTSGTIAITGTSEAANLVLASPNGSAGALTPRALVAADVPTLNQNTTGTAANITATSNSTLTTLPSLALPYSQLSGSVPTWNQSTTGNAATATALASSPLQCSAGQYSTGVAANGNATCSAVSYSQLSGSVPTWNQSTTGNAATATALAAAGTHCSAGQYATGVDASGNALGCAIPSGTGISALTGDGIASGSGSVAFTLATVNTNVGSFGSASSVATFTANGKGLLTAAGSTPIQIAESQVTNLTSDLAGKQATIASYTAPTHQFVNAYAAGAFSAAQPAFSDLSGSIVTGQIPSSTITNLQLVNSGTTVNGQSCVLGASCTVTDSTAVDSVSVASANGLAGTSSGGQNPALTLSTTVTGVVKGNGTALSAAVAGTDYQAPISTSAAGSNQFATGFTAPNTFTYAQPSFSNLSGSLPLTQMASQAADTFVANGTGSAAVPTAITAATAASILPAVIGDSGSGGTQGLVPAPAQYTGEQGYVLSANGSFNANDTAKPIYNPLSFLSATASPSGDQKFTNVLMVQNGQSTYAVVGGGTTETVAIYNVTDQAHPVLRGSINLSGTYGVCGSSASWPYVFVPASGARTLTVLNISNPSSPVVVGTPFSWTANTTSIYACSYYNGLVFMAGQSRGLGILDVGNGVSGGTISAPVLAFDEGGTSTCSVANSCKSFGVAVDSTNSIVYSTNYSTASPWTYRQLKAYSFASSITAPTLLQNLTMTSTTNKPLAVSLNVGTHTAFVSDANNNVVDVVDTTNVATGGMSQISTLSPSSSRVFSPSFAAASFNGSNFVYVPSGSASAPGGIDVFDLTNRSSPVQVNQVTVSGVSSTNFGNIAIDPRGGYIYAGDYGNGTTGAALDLFSLPQENATIGSAVISSLTVKNGITGTLTGNASTATAFAAAPSACPGGQYVTQISANGTPTCATPSGSGNVVGPGSAVSGDAVIFNGTSGTLISDAGFAPQAALATYTAPTNQFVTGYASGTFSAAQVQYSNLGGTVPTWNQNTTGTAANITATSNSTLTTLPSLALPYSQLSGSVPTWNQSTTGNAATATALASSPTQCSSGQYATGVAASGNAACAQVAYSQISGSPGSTSGSSILYGNGSGGFSNVTVGSGLSFSGGSLTATGSGGTVTSVSVASANGFSGSVANATTTPAISIGTTVTGILKGNGSSVSAAVAGTDYAAPTSGSLLLAGNGSGGFTNISTGNGINIAAGVISNNGNVVNGGDAAYAIQTTDSHIRSGTTLTANRTYTLDACTSGNIGEKHVVKNLPSQTFNLVLAGNGSDTVDAASTAQILPGNSLSVICAVAGAWDIQ